MGTNWYHLDQLDTNHFLYVGHKSEFRVWRIQNCTKGVEVGAHGPKTNLLTALRASPTILYMEIPEWRKHLHAHVVIAKL